MPSVGPDRIPLVQIKLLAVLPNFNGGGAERVTLNLLNSLSARGLRIGVLSFLSSGRLRVYLARAVETYDLETGSLKRSMLSVILAVRRLRPAVVFSSLGYVSMAMLVVKNIFPRGTHVWVREANLPSISLRNNRFPHLMHWAYGAFYRRADLVICSSLRMRDELVSGYGVPVHKTRILANPVDECAIRQRAIAAPVPKASAKRFVAAGRLTQQKGFDRLLEMFAEMNDRHAELVILGEGSLEAELKKQADVLGVASQVRFEGFSENPWAWFASADAFLMPSRWEGMPNAALEALACGLPVIATPESGGIAEVAAASRTGVVQVVEAGQPFIEAMKKVKQRSNDVLAPSLLPPQYRLDSVVDTFVSWVDEVV